MRINIQIERLVLDGLQLPGSVHRVMQQAFESELGQLMTENGLSEELLSGGALSSLTAPSIDLAQGAKPDALGQQVAQAVYRGMGQ